MDFNVGKANPATHRFTQYQVRSQGEQMTIQDPQDSRSFEGSLSIAPEQIELYSKGNRYKIEMSPEGVVVSNASRSQATYEMVLPAPLQPEQYRSTGLSVAFSLMGLPLPPQLLQNQPQGEAQPLQFDVSVKDPEKGGMARYEVREQGTQVTVSDPRERMYRGSLDLSQPDQITLFADRREYRIQMSPEGVVVDNPKNDGLRSGMMDLVLQTPLRPEDYKRMGMSVAFSLMKLPLPPHLLG